MSELPPRKISDEFDKLCSLYKTKFSKRWRRRISPRSSLQIFTTKRSPIFLHLHRLPHRCHLRLRTRRLSHPSLQPAVALPRIRFGRNPHSLFQLPLPILDKPELLLLSLLSLLSPFPAKVSRFSVPKPSLRKSRSKTRSTPRQDFEGLARMDRRIYRLLERRRPHRSTLYSLPLLEKEPLSRIHSSFSWLHQLQKQRVAHHYSTKPSRYRKKGTGTG